MNIIVALDGVLSSETGEPIRNGVALFYALSSGHRVSLVTDRSKQDAEHWLHSHGIVNYDDLIDNSFALEGEHLRKRQVTIARANSPVEMYVDNDHEMITWAFEQGMTAVLFAHPSYLPIRHRPDAPKAIRKWGDIQDAIKKNNIAKSLDKTVQGDSALVWDD